MYSKALGKWISWLKSKAEHLASLSSAPEKFYFCSAEHKVAEGQGLRLRNDQL